ncbi:MAG TPA: hypothetical protein VFO10_15910 [Oligoflexus sp.]|uniref:hypothetical protein n=1 Tax=Oligoflexus sp. TaxID=1971216 RepID=UPI002D808BE5|nr:hypothetical protein [Oligoflexus sp.]HET9238746.1 hypothetical protein [Oligoflexus sp.]
MKSILVRAIITAAALAAAQAAYSDQVYPLGEPVNKIDGLVKSFCLLESASGQESKACMEAVNAWAGEEIVASCAEEQAKALAQSPGVKYMNMVGGGQWVTSYHKDEKGVEHRHDWSDSMRDYAGRKLGTSYIEDLRKRTNDEEIQKGTSKSQGEGAGFNGGFDAGVVGSVSKTKDASSGSSQTWTQKGPSQEEIEKAFARGYKDGYQKPDKAGISPDVYCEKGQPTCYSSNGNLKNEHPKSDPPPTKEPTKVPPRVSSDDSSKPADDTSKLADNSSKHDDTKTVEASDSSTKVISDNEEATKNPDTAVSTVANDGVLKLSPMQICVAKAVEKKFGKNGGMGSKVVVQTDSSKTAEELKKINTQLLKMGICDESYWGKAYCTDYLKKLNYGLGASVRGVKVDGSSIFVLPRQPPRPVTNPGAIDMGNPDNFDSGTVWDESTPFDRTLPCGRVFSPGCLSQ